MPAFILPFLGSIPLTKSVAVLHLCQIVKVHVFPHPSSILIPIKTALHLLLFLHIFTGAESHTDSPQQSVISATQHVLVCCLQELGGIVRSLSTTTIQLIDDNATANSGNVYAMVYPDVQTRGYNSLVYNRYHRLNSNNIIIMDLIILLLSLVVSCRVS